MKVYVNYNDRRWKKYRIDFERIANLSVTPKYANAEVSITLTDDIEIHQLNKQYRESINQQMFYHLNWVTIF